MTITLTVTKRIATISATERIVAGNTYPIALALDSEWTGSLFMRVRFGSQYYDIPFASSDASVNVQFPVGYPEVGIGVFSEALEICTNETRVRLLRSILEQGVSVVEFDSDLYDQWAGEVSELLCDDAFDSTSDRPVKNSVITAWKDTVPLDSALVHKAGTETITGTKTFTDFIYLESSTYPPEIRMISRDTATSGWKSRIRCYATPNGQSRQLTSLETYASDDYNRFLMRTPNPSASRNYDLDLRIFSDHMTAKITPWYPVDGSGNPIPVDETQLMTSGNVAIDPRIVHTTGTETIAGEKTFTSLLTASNVAVKDTSTPTVTMLKGSTEVASLASDEAQAGITASSQFFGLRGLGTAPFGQAPSYTADNNADAKIVTRSMLATTPTVVHTTGAETIAGAKTFSAPIEGMFAQTSVANASVTEGRWVKCLSIPAQNGVNLHFSVRTSYNTPDFSYAKFSIGTSGNIASAVSAHCTLSTGYTQETASMSNYKVTLETVDGVATIVFYAKKLIRYSSMFIEEKRFYTWNAPTTQVTLYYNEASADEPVASDTVSIIPIVGYYLGGVQA